MFRPACLEFRVDSCRKVETCVRPWWNGFDAGRYKDFDLFQSISGTSILDAFQVSYCSAAGRIMHHLRNLFGKLWTSNVLFCYIIIYLSIYLSIPIVSYYILINGYYGCFPHILRPIHSYISPPTILGTVSCTLLESRLCDLQCFHSSLWVSWLCSSAEVGSRHPETMLMAVETLTGLIFSQFGGYMCTLLHTLYVCIVPVIPKR